MDKIFELIKMAVQRFSASSHSVVGQIPQNVVGISAQLVFEDVYSQEEPLRKGEAE